MRSASAKAPIDQRAWQFTARARSSCAKADAMRSIWPRSDAELERMVSPAANRLTHFSGNLPRTGQAQLEVARDAHRAIQAPGCRLSRPGAMRRLPSAPCRSRPHDGETWRWRAGRRREQPGKLDQRRDGVCITGRQERSTGFERETLRVLQSALVVLEAGAVPAQLAQYAVVVQRSTAL